MNLLNRLQIKNMETLDSWKVNINNFYPVGLKHYGNDKIAVVIVWSSNSLLTKKFRSFTNAIENNFASDKDQVRRIGDTISQVIPNTLETAILTDHERLMYFETHKVLRKVDNLKNVKAICTSKGTFVIMHLNDEGNIQIVLHPDSFPCQPKHLRSFDVSFDRSYCQSTWNDAHFNVVTLYANAEQPEFFNSLRKYPGEQYTADDRYIFFSIDNTLLSLVVDTDDYRYHQVHTHSSNIRGIHSSKDLNSIYVLLQSGVIDVIYLCEILGVIKTSSLYFMYDVGAYDICDDIFVYSDGFQVVIGHIEYSSDTRSYKTNQKTIPLPGIVSFTTVKTYKTVLCISENRIFYKIPYAEDEFFTTNSDPNVMLPVREFLATANRTTIDIQQLVDYSDRIKSELLTQHKMFDALALRFNYNNDKSPLRFPLKAKLKIHRTLPDLPITAIYPTTTTIGIDTNACYLQVQMEPHRFGNIFSSNIWSLGIHCDTDSQTSKVYRLIDEDFSEPLDILLALTIRNHIVPPRVNVKLSTSVKIGQDVICISFPVHTDLIDYADMIKLSNKIPHFQIATKHRNSNLQPMPLKQSLTTQLNLPKSIPMNELMRDIDSTSKFECKDNSTCYLSLFNSFLEVSVDDTLTKICLKSRDAAVMFHVKRFIFDRLRTIFNLTVDSGRTDSVQKYIVSRNFDFLFLLAFRAVSMFPNVIIRLEFF